jgi:TP901 family phage tail tape measure protein
LAGQLNVATGSIAEFTETVAKFVATSDVTVDAAATAFGRLDQLVAGVDGQFEKLGAAISAVGVNAVATESEIIAISSQIASVANIAGFGAGELVGFASALASVGTRPELARGTFTRLFTEISQAVAGTKDTLDDFSRLAGMSATDFQDAWGRGEGPELVINFLKGLQAEGRDAELALRQVGITSVRDVPTLLKLAQGVEEVENQLAIAKIAFIEGTELQRQYSIVASTVAEKLQVLKNSIQALVATVGSGAGALGFLVDIFIGLVNVIQKILDNPINKFIVGLTTAVVGLVGGMGLLLAAVARAGAGFAGLLTATTETSKAIAATRLNVQGLNTDLQTTSATAATAGTSLKTFGGSAISTSPALATANSGISQLVGPNGLPLVTKEAGKATDKMSKGLIPSLFRVGKATKLVPIAAFALKFAAIYAGTLLLIKGIDSLGKRFGLWGKEIENVNSELGDLTPFLSSIKRDTEDFNSGITSAQDGLIFFRGEVKSSSVELSEQGKIIASVTGQQELLEQSVDGSTTAIAKQTLVIGENTLALIKQKVAQDVINDSQGVSIDNVRELIRLNNLLAESSSGSFGVDINTITEARSQVGRRGAEVGVASVFAIVSDPRLNEALKEAGFNVAEFFDLIARGNEEAALSLLSNLVPAAEKTREALLDSGASEAADEIAYLDGIIAFGVQGLSEYTSSGTRLTAAVKELIFQQTLMGDAFEDTSDAVKTFQDAMKNAVDEAYSFVNAQRDMEQAVYRLGEAFAQESPEVVANSREMQAAIKAVLDTASSPEEAIQNLSGFYKSIVDGGYASGESLAILQQFIIDTYNTFAAAQLESLKKTREMILASNEMRRAVGAGMRGITGPAYEQTFQELEDINSQIAITENAIGNIYAIISSSSGPSYTNQLASGFNSVGSAASGAAEQVKTFNDIVRELTSILFAAINAQNAAEEAIFSLGEAFGSSGREALGASREIQTAVTTILETSNSGAEAVANLSGLFGVLSNTAGVSSKDLKILRDVIFEVGRAAGLTDKQIRALLNSFGEGLTTLNFDNFNLGVQSATENLETFQDTIGGFLTDLFSFVNASNAAQNSVFALGQAFGESGDTALYASSEMQSAIGNIVAASGDGREAVANLSALFGTLSNTAGVSRESLNALEQTIYAVGREAGLSDREIRRLINSFGGSEATVSLDNFANGLESVNTQIVTLLDYANQLSGVLSRAFDLRFGTIIQLDAISQSWLDIGDRIDAARKSIRELQILQRDLAADRAIKEYFLTIAEAYGDNLRAAKLREEIADIDERLGESAEDLARAEREASGELAGNTIEAINNRQALIALLGQYQSYITTLAASGASQEELSAAVQEAKDLFIAQATQLGFSEEAVNEYAESFDDMATIIAELPRDVTINLEANANPALTALNEVNAAIQRNTTAALELNAALNLPVAAATPPRPQTSASPGVGSTSGSTSGTSGTSGTPGSGPSAPTAAASSTEKQIDAAKKQRKSLIAERKRLQGMLRGMPAGAPRTAIQGQISSLTAAINQLEVTLRRLGVAPGNFNFAKGGFTGRGGKYDPAGIVHKGEFVVPKEFVNQSTGTPDLAFLAALQNGVRSYAQGGMVGSSVSMPDAMMVELSPYDRKLLQEAGNVQLMLNGRVVAEATNSSNLVSAQRGSN